MHFKGFLSLILEEKELKQLCLKNNTFYCNFFLFCKFQSRSMHSKKKKGFQKKKVSNLPTFFFQAVTWTTHIFLFGLNVTNQNIIVNIYEIVFSCPLHKLYSLE